MSATCVSEGCKREATEVRIVEGLAMDLCGECAEEIDMEALVWTVEPSSNRGEMLVIGTVRGWSFVVAVTRTSEGEGAVFPPENPRLAEDEEHPRPFPNGWPSPPAAIVASARGLLLD